MCRGGMEEWKEGDEEKRSGRHDKAAAQTLKQKVKKLSGRGERLVAVMMVTRKKVNIG